MEWRCLECGAPLTRKKCDYCGARNNKVKKQPDAYESAESQDYGQREVGETKVPTGDVSKESWEQRQEKKEGCSDGCASGCADACVSGCA